jgi:hypothetical protein
MKTLVINTTTGKVEERSLTEEQLREISPLAAFLYSALSKGAQIHISPNLGGIKTYYICDCPEEARMHMTDEESDECTICGKKFY